MRHIRRARPDDHAALLSIWDRSVRATHHFLSGAEVDALYPLVSELLAGDALELWVLAAADDTPLGFLGMAGSKVDALFLAPESTGSGGGRELVDHAQALAGDELTTDVNEQNPAALAFYERLGFVVEGRSPLDDAGRPYPLLHLRRPVPVQRRSER